MEAQVDDKPKGFTEFSIVSDLTWLSSCEIMVFVHVINLTDL